MKSNIFADKCTSNRAQPSLLDFQLCHAWRIRGRGGLSK